MSEEQKHLEDTPAWIYPIILIIPFIALIVMSTWFGETFTRTFLPQSNLTNEFNVFDIGGNSEFTPATLGIHDYDYLLEQCKSRIKEDSNTIEYDWSDFQYHCCRRGITATGCKVYKEVTI